jgi:hypothetical protein
LQAERSGAGYLYARETQFTPHILSIITEEKFLQWAEQLQKNRSFWDDARRIGYQPSQTEVLNFLSYVVKNLLW